LPKYAYGYINCFPAFHNFLNTGAKVQQERKLKGTKVVCGAKVPGCESSMERKFLEHSLVTSCDTTAGSKRLRLLFTGDVDEMFMTRSLKITPKTTEQHLIVHSDKRVAYVTNNKRLQCARHFVLLKLNY